MQNFFYVNCAYNVCLLNPENYGRAFYILEQGSITHIRSICDEMEKGKENRAINTQVGNIEDQKQKRGEKRKPLSGTKDPCVAMLNL